MENKDIDKKIIISWVILVVLVICIVTLTILKITNNNKVEVTESMPTENINNTTSILDSIVTRFNENNLITDYQNEKLSLSASVDDKSIIIAYNGEGNIIYNYDSDKNILTSTKDKNLEQDIYDKAFKVLAIACTNNDNDEFLSSIDNFLNGENIEGFTKNDNTYTIDIINITTTEDTENNE